MQRFANSNFHYFRYPFDRFLKESKCLGFSGVLLWGSVPHLWTDSHGHESLDRIKGEIDRSGMKVAGFLPRIYSYSFFAAPDSPQYQASSEYYRDSIRIAKELKADYLCLELQGSLRDIDCAMQLDYSVEFVRGLIQEASQAGVNIALSSADQMVATLEEISDYINRLAIPEAAVALDIGSALTKGESISEWFDRFGDRIRMVYLSDGRINGGYALGTGCFPVEFVLKELERNNYNGFVSMKLDRDRYELDPFEADAQNISVLRQLISREGLK